MAVIYGKIFNVIKGIDLINPESNSMLINCQAYAEPVVPFRRIAHWDFWQGIARIKGKDNRQYAAALLENIILAGNTIDGRGTTLQCIFSSDGRIKKIVVSDNTLDTDGDHKITLSGVQSGVFENNKDFDGNPIPAILESLRIGGVARILSFKDADDEYQECLGCFEDYRRIPGRQANGVDLIDFDLKGFLQYTNELLPDKGDGETIARLSAEAALLFGTEYIDGETIMNEKLVHDVMRLSPAGVEDLVDDEGIELRVYLDQAGYKTIGVGRKLLQEEIEEGWISIGGELVEFETTGITMAQAEQLFKEDVAPREEELSRLLIGVDVSQDQFDALFSLMYNIGGKNFSTSTVLRRLKSGDFAGVPEAMRRWNKITLNGEKVPSAGLTARRKREADKFAGGVTGRAFRNQTVTSTLGAQVFKGAAQIVADSVVTEPDAHETKLESTTMQGILGMVVSWFFMFLVSKGWFPESLSQMIQPVVVEGLLGVVGLFFTKKAYTGRLNAVKGFK